MMLPQSERCLSLARSKDIMVLPDPEISYFLVYIWNVSALNIIHNLMQVSPIGHSAQANIQYLLHADCIYLGLNVTHESVEYSLTFLGWNDNSGTFQD